MLIKILSGIGLVVIAVVIFAALKPAQMYVFREVVVKAKPEMVFPYINNSKMADDWMPWHESDPSVKMNYSGPDEGVGSKSYWESTGKMGTGEALVVESVANQLVKTKLTYTKPFVMSQLAEMSLTPLENGTKVKWAVSGESGFFFRLMGIFVDCDKMIGSEFEKGLTKLKSKVETKEGAK